MTFVADPGMYAKQDRFEANRQRLQNQKFDRVGRKEIRKMDMAKYEANRRKLQNQKFDRVGRKEIRKMDMAKYEANRKKLQNQKLNRVKKKPPTIDTTYNYDVNVRFCDHPRPGSIFRLPDIPQIVRGPTLVLLPSGKEITVPASAKHEVVAEADIHNATEGNLKLESLLKLLTLKDSDKTGTVLQRAMQHPREGLRLANHMGMNLAF